MVDAEGDAGLRQGVARYDAEGNDCGDAWSGDAWAQVERQ